MHGVTEKPRYHYLACSLDFYRESSCITSKNLPGHDKVIAVSPQLGVEYDEKGTSDLWFR